MLYTEGKTIETQYLKYIARTEPTFGRQIKTMFVLITAKLLNENTLGMQ